MCQTRRFTSPIRPAPVTCGNARPVCTRMFAGVSSDVCTGAGHVRGGGVRRPTGRRRRPRTDGRVSVDVKRWGADADSRRVSMTTPRMERQEPRAVDSSNTDDLAAVLAAVIASTRSDEDICDHTGLALDTVQAAIADLVQRDIIGTVYGGYCQASQARCAGPCSRAGREMRGKEVVVDAQTLGWACADCWDAGVEPEHSGVQSEPGDNLSA